MALEEKDLLSKKSSNSLSPNANSHWSSFVAWCSSLSGGDIQEADRRLFVRISALIIVLGCCIICWRIYDDHFGYLGALKTKLKVLRNSGWSSLNMMKTPMSPEALSRYFANLREAGNLTSLELHQVQAAALARRAHDSYFGLKIFHFDQSETAAHMAMWAVIWGVTTVLLYLAPIFLTLYALWFLLKYFKYWTKAALGYMLEVTFKFIVDWIVAEVKKVFAEIVNTIVKVLTFGIKKGKTVNVSMPKYTDYVNKWYKKYITPILRDIDSEYGCRIDTTKRKVAKALGWVLLPVKQIYTWYAKLKRYGMDLPLDQFRETVLQSYPGFVKANAKYADDLTELDKRFYEYLKKQQSKRNKLTKKLSPTRKQQAAAPHKTSNLALDTLDLRAKHTNTSTADDVCAVIK